MLLFGSRFGCAHLVNVSRDCPGCGEGTASQRGSGGRDTISVVRRQEAVVAWRSHRHRRHQGCLLTVHGHAPVGVLEVVTAALNGAVPGRRGAFLGQQLRICSGYGLVWASTRWPYGDPSSPLDLALWRHEEVRAVLLHAGLCRVDQGQPVGDGVPRQGVLLGQDPEKSRQWWMYTILQPQLPARLVDDSAKIAHILDLKLPPNGSQSDPLPS